MKTCTKLKAYTQLFIVSVAVGMLFVSNQGYANKCGPTLCKCSSKKSGVSTYTPCTKGGIKMDCVDYCGW